MESCNSSDLKTDSTSETQVDSGVDDRVPVYSSAELLEKLQEKWKAGKKQPYPAMYSSIFGGITLDPALMVIPIDDHMVHRGHGVFDTAMILNGYLYELDKHLDRFLRSASKAKISSPFPRSTLRGILVQLTAASQCKKGSLRYWLSAGPGDFLLSPAGCPTSAFYAVVIEDNYSQCREGVQVITSTIPMKSPLFATMKNVNYLPNVLSKMEAEEKEAYASIWVDEEGYIAEGPNVNVAFISKDKELLLPSFDKILSGCTAKRLIELAPKLVEQGLLKSVRTADITVEEGKNAAEMMYVGSSLPILPIIMWDEQSIGDGKVGELTLALSDLLWEDMVAGPGLQRINTKVGSFYTGILRGPAFLSPAQTKAQPSGLNEARKSPTSLARIEDFSGHGQDHPHLSLGLLNSSPSPKKKTPSKSPLSLHRSDSIPLQEIILLSPSPHRRSRTRLAERMEMVEEPIDQAGHRKRCKTRASPMGQLGCASPRINVRRSRRRLEQENRDEREMGLGDEIVKPRKRRQSNRSRKEKLSLVATSSLSPKAENDEHSSLDNIRQLISDLIMWKDVAKSSLWFGFGSLCFLSSCSTQGIRYSVFSGVSHLCLLFLALSFFCNSCSQRNNNDQKLDFELKEDDIVRVARKMLPVANLVISKMRELFSGEPSMTLKVAPFLLFGAEYGHLITLWRLCAIGFFISFTAPKLYSCYSMQIKGTVEFLGGWMWEAWRACSHKKIVAISAALAFWNLSSIKTRIFSAFVCMVVLRYRRQHSKAKVEGEGKGEGEGEMQVEGEEQGKALVVVEKEGSQK
ncbi:Aminotransferase [Macleaya cordata]|uniref:Reticulon-like protein n=1 Tax=Macleaya cordata TaxID=56857 RepID=A0A200QM05_MACCD|nr:Aminotransferase [Macleaya cordata]